MANNLIQNPMKVDTAFSTKASATVGLSVPPGGWQIDEVYWYNPATAADTFTIALGDGNTVIRQGRCEAANQSQVFKMYGMRIDDFQVPTLSSGVLYIYYR